GRRSRPPAEARRARVSISARRLAGICSAGCSFARLLAVEAEGGVALLEQAIAVKRAVCIRQGDGSAAGVLGDDEGFGDEKRGGGFGKQVEGLGVGGQVFPGRVEVDEGEVLRTAGKSAKSYQHAALF